MAVLNATLRLYLRSFVKSVLTAVLCCVFFSTSVYASICFLPDCEDKKKNEGGDAGAQACLDAGYESEKSLLCSEYSIIRYCPQNSKFLKCDDAAWCTINGYINTECESPYELFNKCPNGLEMYKECKLSMEDVCKQENPNYVDICPAGWTLDPNNKCSYSDEWGTCCNMCPGYEYTDATLPSGSTAVASCNSCDGKRYIISNIGNICEGFWDCQDGCEIGSETCTSYNGAIKCKTCKRCEARCSNLTCPENALCDYENCTQRYCDPTGCKAGYSNLCTKPLTDCWSLGYTKNKGSCLGAHEVYCPFDNNKVYCMPDDGTCCNKCKGYPEDSIPSGYIATATCECCGYKKYKIAVNPCTGYQICKFGPASSSTASCKSGNQMMYKSCKNCPNGTDYTSCPVGTICVKDECSGTYIPTGCATGYGNFCKTPITNCRELGYDKYSSDCDDKFILKCPYDSNRVMCVGDKNVDQCYDCKKLPYVGSIPAGYTQTAYCLCEGVKYYDAKVNTCSGYQECEFGPATSTTASCRTPEKLLYAVCKDCPNGTDYTSCPVGSICVKDECSGTYIPTGCATGYGNFCKTPITNCRELGYKKWSDEECNGAEVLRCPYDSSRVYCRKKE